MPTTRNKNNESLPQVTIYTDGACTGNPGPGGWGVLLKFNGRKKEMSGGEPETTNNRMELTGAINALKALNRPCRVQFYTDSQYVRKGITEWISAWKRRGWKTTGKKPVKNQELWRELDAVIEQHEIQWYWVRGHAGQRDNERVDKLARDAIPKT